MRRLLGVPFLYTAAASAVGFSVYFSIGVVADYGLGLTPLIFLAAGLMFALTTLTYVEGGAMFRERGGSSMFARHAFNELVSFIAGWAILIDYAIVIAAAAITVPHYLTPISSEFAEGGAEIVVAAAVIVFVAMVNVLGITGANRQTRLVALAFADLVLQLAVIGIGVAVLWDPSALTDNLEVFGSPSLEDAIYAAVVATIAFAGIEAASDLAPDLEFEPDDLRRVLTAGSVVVPLMYAGIAAIALMAVPVVPGADGPETALAGDLVENPILGVVQQFEPGWLASTMEWLTMLVAVPVLIWAASTAMLGVSRHVYSLATNRQIPSWAGKLHAEHSTPFVAIGIASVLALALALPADIKFLAAVYAFGALLAATIAHLSVIRLRFTDPDRERPYRVPFNLRRRRGDQVVLVPIPAAFAGLVSALALLSVFLFHEEAVYVGGGWMAFGLVAYVFYRLVVENTSLTKRVSVPESALKKQVEAVRYSTILVPVFGTPLDDDIVPRRAGWPTPRRRRGRSRRSSTSSSSPRSR